MVVWTDVASILASTGAIVVYITAIVGAIISGITSYYTRKGYHRTSLAEAFRLFNEPRHREARKVIYGEETLASYEILGFVRPTADGGASHDELKTLCKNIVRSDFNEIGTLVYHKLLDGKIFV